jgi:hypothetical protein
MSNYELKLQKAFLNYQTWKMRKEIHHECNELGKQINRDLTQALRVFRGRMKYIES